MFLLLFQTAESGFAFPLKSNGAPVLKLLQRSVSPPFLCDASKMLSSPGEILILFIPRYNRTLQFLPPSPVCPSFSLSLQGRKARPPPFPPPFRTRSKARIHIPYMKLSPPFLPYLKRPFFPKNLVRFYFLWINVTSLSGRSRSIFYHWEIPFLWGLGMDLPPLHG